MLFKKRKKLTFIFKPKPKVFREKQSGDDVRYFKLIKEYGSPTLTEYGEHVWPQSDLKFVRDAQTGKVICRERAVRYLGSRDNLHFYLDVKSTLTRNKAIPSFHV